MDVLEENYLYRNESYRIIGCCMEVHKRLGCGFKEAVYQEALEMEFIENALLFEREKKLRIRYKENWLKKKYYPDFICFNKIIVELKATSDLTDIYKAQLFNYLKASELRLGLLINFGSTTLQFKRFIL
jgi:GxxExxY protein